MKFKTILLTVAFSISSLPAFANTDFLPNLKSGTWDRYVTSASDGQVIQLSADNFLYPLNESPIFEGDHGIYVMKNVEYDGSKYHDAIGKKLGNHITFSVTDDATYKGTRELIVLSPTVVQLIVMHIDKNNNTYATDTYTFMKHWA